MEKQKQKEYQLADVVMRMVIKEDDRLVLHPRAAEGFKMAMDALFAHPTLDPKEEIEALVRLGWLFERDQMFELADQVLDLMAADERALGILGIANGKSRDAKKNFAKLAGADQKLAAPVYGKEAPKGSMKVSSFLEPGREIDKRSAQRAKRAETGGRASPDRDPGYGRGVKPNPSKPKAEPKRRIKS